MTDDDRRAVNDHRQLASHGDAQPLRLELAALVGVSESLASVEFVLLHEVGAVAGDEGRAHVVEPSEPASPLDGATEIDHVCRAGHVPAPRLVHG